MLNNKVLALVQLGRLDEAGDAARSALRTLPSRAHLIFNSLALGDARLGRCDEAAMVLGYCDSVWRSHERVLDPAEAAVSEETLALLGARLGRPHAQTLMEAGASMTASEVSAMALASIVGPEGVSASA